MYFQKYFSVLISLLVKSHSVTIRQTRRKKQNKTTPTRTQKTFPFFLLVRK